MIVRHLQNNGRPLIGSAMINQFLDWVSQLKCGLDLMSETDFRAP